LLNKGVSIQGFDPQAMKTSREEIPEPVLCQNPYNIAEGTDTIPLANEWNESKLSDFKRVKANMRGRMIVDGRISGVAVNCTHLDLIILGCVYLSRNNA
jgi:UDPglucose 6-dehydrogenase